MISPPARIDQSYRGLLRVPQLSRVLASMMLARVGNAMVGVAIVLFTLEAYDSPALAGLVTLAYILPGILVSPIAGALLDRHGRVRLIILDYIVSGSTLGIIALLALGDRLPAGLLVVIAALASLTSILSATGLRSLFPIMVPKQLWERVNAVDSNGYIVATILGPPIAAALVTVVGGPQTLAIIGGLMLLATIPLIGVRDPAAPKPAEAPLLREAWDGVLYVWHNPTLRGLAFSISTLNIAGGVASIAIPLLVLRQLGFSPALVGLAFAVSGITGMVSSAFFGRFDTRGREWRMLVVPMALTVPTVALLLPVAASAPAGTPGGIAPLAGIVLVIASQALFGILNGPLDIALFTVRQRRTDPAIMGRAFAVSMAANFVGYPLGSAIAGLLATTSLASSVGLGVVACVVATVFATVLIPARAPAAPQPATPSFGSAAAQTGSEPVHRQP